MIQDISTMMGQANGKNINRMVIRKATQYDSAFIARMIMMSMHMEKDEQFYSELCAVAKRDDTLYSWQRSMIAEVDGNPVGLCLAYDAACYHEMRSATFPLLPSSDPSTNQQEDETGPGEFYIDTLAVEPEYRRLGIASCLLRNAIEKAETLSLTPTILVVHYNLPALNLYRKIGFCCASEQFVYGEIYQKWKYGKI